VESSDALFIHLLLALFTGTHTHNLLLNTLDSTEFLFSLAGNVFIEHLSSCHCYNNIHLSVSLNFQLLPVIQGSLLFFFPAGIRLTPFYDHTALKVPANGLNS